MLTPPPVDDGEVVAEVGEWSHDKHYFLARYIDAFTTAMRNKWEELHYIDLFAGPGIEKLKESNKREYGSPLIAARTKYPFTKLHLVEKVKSKYKALEVRISCEACNAQVHLGDGNAIIHTILKEIPRAKSLSLAFLDPYGLHLDFSTLQALAVIRADLIIFFPDYIDALRNCELNYWENPDSNLDRYLGEGCQWREKLDTVPVEKRSEELRKLYVEQLGTLGYREFGYERISFQGHPLYRLIFCSRHKTALKIWNGISNTKPDGQKWLF